MTPSTVTMAQWASSQRSDLVVTSASYPEPVLKEHNLIGRFTNPDDARHVLLAWERIEAADAAVGMVAMGRLPASQPASQPSADVDPEHVASHAARRSLAGAIPGAVIGALVVMAFVFIYEGGSSTGGIVGGFFGGLLFGAVAGGMLSFVLGTGWGAAYQESFVDETATDVVFASIHSDSPEEIDAAINAATAIEAQHLARVDRSGRLID